MRARFPVSSTPSVASPSVCVSKNPMRLTQTHTHTHTVSALRHMHLLAESTDNPRWMCTDTYIVYGTTYSRTHTRARASGHFEQCVHLNLVHHNNNEIHRSIFVTRTLSPLHASHLLHFNNNTYSQVRKFCERIEFG